MSYAFSGRAVDGKVVEWSGSPQSGYAEEESKADIAFAKDLATMGAAQLGGEVSISGGGHSNPGRAPEDRWAKDCMNISLSRL